MPLEYDKYLIGRSYLLFKSAIRSGKSLQFYKQNLWHFCNFIGMSTDEIVSKYGSSSGKDAMNFQQMVEDYVLLLQTKISNKEITATTAQTMIPPIKLLCEMNDIILNWRKIGRLLPRGDRNASDDAYTRDQIKKMLQHSDLRAKIAILFMSSGGMRLGGFIGLTDGAINPIYDDNKVIAAQVTIYKGADEEYDTFVSPEAFHSYEAYRNLRIKFGEQITKNSPILLRRFDISPDGKKAEIDNSRPITLSTVAGIIRNVAYKAGVREVSENYKGRYNIKIAHGFRKFFSTTLSNIKTKDGRTAIDFIKKEWLLGHALRTIHSLEENYNRSDRINLLLQEYQKAVKELTISDEERLKVDVEKLQTDITNMRSVSVELHEKDKQIAELIKRQEEMEKKFRIIFSKIDVEKLG